MKRLERSFYLRPTQKVAKDLVGKIICHRVGKKILRARIVETEAYLGLKDPACHIYHGKKTTRALNLYRLGGHSYVYLIYGMYDCFNVVTNTEQAPEAVLIRAAQPLTGFVQPLATNGPGKLCRSMKITRKQNGLDLTDSLELWLEADDFKIKKKDLVAVPRVGIDYAAHAVHWPLRFYLKDNLFVSRI